MPLQRTAHQSLREATAPARGHIHLPTYCFGTTTIDSLSSNPSPLELAKRAAETQMTGRQTWRTVSGRPEAVWPPELCVNAVSSASRDVVVLMYPCVGRESLLIEGMKKYHDEIGLIAEVKPNGEYYFPLRNAFIANYIERLSGRPRSLKQVSSRIQQLKNRCQDSKMLALILRGRVGLSSPMLKCPLPFLSPLAYKKDVTCERPPSIVFVQVAASLQFYPIQVPVIPIGEINLTSLTTITLATSTRSTHPVIPATRPLLKPLSLFSNSIRISSAFPLKRCTHFTVYENDMVILEEDGFMGQVLCHGDGRITHVYDFEVVSCTWQEIVESQNPNDLTIIQTVFPDTPKLRSAVKTPESVDIVYYFGRCDYSPYRHEGHIAYENARLVPGDFLKSTISPLPLVSVIENGLPQAPLDSGYMDSHPTPLHFPYSSTSHPFMYTKVPTSHGHSVYDSSYPAQHRLLPTA
ncbi:hypothetical protein H1R20_g4516, partial [Candolleomyces eurysporus]